MPSRDIISRLEDGEKILMDGGTGSEIHRRGVDVMVGSSTNVLGTWSATANVEAPDVVQQIHADYLRVGADIVTTNTVFTTPTRMAIGGLEDRWREYATSGGLNAVKARDAANSEAYVAAGMATPWVCGMTGDRLSDVQHMGEPALKAEFSELSEAVAEAGVDIMLPEFIGYVDDCVAALDVVAEFELPVFLGVRQIQPDGTMVSGETMDQLAATLKGHRVDAVLLMCCNPEAISAGLPRLRDAFSGAIGAYPNIGYNPLARLRGTSADDFFGLVPNPPSRLAQYANDWLDMGAQIVGGCCGTGPEHIMAMRKVVKGW